MTHARAAPPGARILDLACGRGRHALPLAREGREVIGVDLALTALHALRAQARVSAIAADLGALPLRDEVADMVLCVNFLDRALFPHLHRLLRPGGRVILETFLVEQRTLGRGPQDPAHLLAPGELSTLVGPLRVVEMREGLVRDAAGERYVAGVVAVNA